MPNKALAKAIIDSGEKKQTIARRAQMEPWELSKAIHNDRPLSDTQQELLAEILNTPKDELFPAHSEAVAS